MHSFDSPLTRSKTDNPCLLAALQQKITQVPEQQYHSVESELDKSIRSNINQLLESSSAGSQPVLSSPNKNKVK